MGTLVTQFTTTRKNLVHYTVSESKDATTYDDVIAGDTLLPANSMVTLVDEDDVATTKFNNLDTDAEWDAAELMTVSSTGVSEALALKPEIAALDSESTTAEIVEALQA